MGIGDFLNSVGDAIEDGVESATEKVGQAYNTVLDAESKVAKAVGADGLSEWLDDLGDKVVDATGGAVPEKELGQTSDPKELIRGDVGKINEVTGHLGKIGTAIEQTGDALRKIDTADWTGDAATAFDEEFAKQPKLWWDGADAMGKAKTALDAWAHEVTAAQAKAADAIAKWEEADREERDRKNAWNALSDDDRKGKNLTDTWTDIRNAAKAILTGARTQRDNAADTAVAAISAATATAPTEPPFLSRWGSNFEDLNAAIEQARLNFSTGLLTSLTGMVQFVRSISPIDAYNITHPAEYMSSMSDLGTGMVLAAADPKATGAAMLAGFKTNPSEALGALTGDALLTVATGGAGGAAKAGATVVDKASDAARLGIAGRNVVDDAAGAAGRNVPESPGTPASPHAPDNPAAPPTNPAAHNGDSPAANPAGTTPDSPRSDLLDGDSAPSSNGDARPNPDAGSPDSPRTPEPESPTLHDNPPDNAPAAKPDDTDDGPPVGPSPDTDGANPNPAASPDAHSPNTPDNHDGDNSPGDGDSGKPGPHHDGADNNAADPDPTQPGSRNDDEGNSPGQPDNNSRPELRSDHDNGGNGEPSASEAAQKNPPETDSTRDQTCEGGDPVNIATGEFLLPVTDLDLPGILRLALKRAHHSNYRFGRWFGPSWSATLDMRVVVESGCVTVVFEDGMLLAYPHAEVGVGVVPITGGQRWKLTRTDLGGYRLWDPDRELVWHFAPEPVLGGLDSLLGNYAISAITDRHNNRIRFHYNSNGDPTTVTHSGGYRVVLDSADGRVTAISVAGEVDGIESITRVREFGYERGELTTVTNGVGGITRFVYDDHHRMLSWTDSNGSWVANTYDEAGRVVAQRGTDGIMDADFEYLELGNGTGRLTRHTNSRGGVTGYGFDNDLRLRDVIAPDGGHRHIDYNAARKPLTVTETDGAVTTYSYTPEGEIAKITRPDGTDISVDYAYTNRPATITNPDGTSIHREWDKHGNLRAHTDAAGARTQYAYSACGATTEIRDHDGAVTHIQVDPTGLPAAVTDPHGATTTISRDPFGRPAKVTDALGHTTFYKWTPEGRLSRRVDPDGFAETWTYDGENNLLTHTDRNGGITHFTYSGFDNVASRTDPDGATTHYLHNTERQLVAVINPLGQRWSYEYDTVGRLIAETDYTGATTSYTHTITGRVATVTPATGITRHHSYDVLGHLTAVTADTGEYIHYTRDAAGRVLTASNGNSESQTHTLAYTYTPTGLVATQQRDHEPALRNDYDRRGRRIRRTTPAGNVTTWHHNTLGQTTALDADGHAISFTHDRAGRLTQWRIGEVQIERTFTKNGNIAAQHATGFPAAQFSLDFGENPDIRPAPFTIRHDDYTYRADGYLTDHTIQRPDTTPVHDSFGLDRIGQVTTITRDHLVADAYEYDALSNITARRTPGSAVDDELHTGTEGREYHNNLLVRDGRNHYYYDASGRLIRKVTTRLSRKPAVWHYRYNAFDQLTDVYTPDGQWWQYTYDAANRRTAKYRLNSKGERLTHTTFEYDGSQLIEESSGDRTSRWQYLPATHIPILQIEESPSSNVSNPCAVLTDISGVPHHLVDPSTGRSLALGSVDLWGNISWKGDCSTPIRFAGQYHDPETSLHYNIHRYFDPSQGRYLTPDPLGLSPAPNQYGYPHNPIRWCDPLGLAPEECTGGNQNAPSTQPPDEPPRTLYHYTNQEGHDGILDSQELRPSLREQNPKDARYGDGQYLTDVQPGTRTLGQLSYDFLRVPWAGQKFTHFLEIDVTGLEVVQGRPGVFVVPNSGPLDLAGRIIRSGRN
ncbi:putative T7SS-secreted protein [Nocardia sp. NPDC060259]|uniref:putative T7SS-secreted protein n=1 Tax=Nocardia sp. NPDC060259 TaxID=3347088 RepID=UPI00365340DA